MKETGLEFDGTENFYSSFGVVGIFGILVACANLLVQINKLSDGAGFGVVAPLNTFLWITIFVVGIKTLRSPVLSVVGDSETGFMLLETSVWAWWKSLRIIALHGCDGYNLEKTKLVLSFDGTSQSFRAGNLKKADRERMEEGMKRIYA